VSLPHILLALLADRPDSGYALKKRIDDELSPLWNAELSQIYPVLGRLERAGFVSGKVVGPDRGPGSFRLRPTASGRRELARWLAESPSPPALRDESLVRAVLVAAFGGPGGSLDSAYEQTLGEAVGQLRRKSPAGPLSTSARDAALGCLEGLRRWARGREENRATGAGGGRARTAARRKEAGDRHRRTPGGRKIK